MKDAGEEFHGRIILVTGAGKGIGRATAELLASHGASILALSRTTSDLASLKAEIGCETIAADLVDLKNLLAAVHKAQPFDLLVNCAGTTALDPFVDLKLETFDHIMTVNAKAAMLRDHPRDGCRAWTPRHPREFRQSKHHDDGYGPKGLERSRARCATPRAHGDWPLFGGR
jgi:NAD(P)-dependent dehydrogenase (short-subunit alcohol dehydrogenase family)